MNSRVPRRLIVLAVAVLGLSAWSSVSASAAEPYEFEPELSLIGACGKSALDPVEDPGCPGGSHPPKGRFATPKSVAIDVYGNEYVASYGDKSKGVEGRIDVFDDDGHFITELSDPFGPKSLAVDTKGNLYVVEQNEGTFLETARYSPTMYKPEQGEISYHATTRDVIAVDEALSTVSVAVDLSNDHVFFVYAENGVSVRPIREYGSAEEGNPLLSKITNSKLGVYDAFLAIDAQRGRIYASYCQNEAVDCGILVFDLNTYALLEEINGPPGGEFASTKGWLGLAVDEKSGDFFVADLEGVNQAVYQFDENYELVSKLTSSAFSGGNALQIAISNSPLNPDARNLGYLFVPVPKASGSVLAFQPPGIEAPEILEDEANGLRGTATGIGETEAILRATIAPNGADAEYSFEIEAEGSGTRQLVGEGTIPAATLEGQVSAVAESLAPGTTYRFFVHAQNVAGADDAEGAFTTYSDAPLSGPPCPNQDLRAGLSSSLPDCRAYELVSPGDTNGRTLVGLPFGGGDRFATVLSNPAGSAVSFLLQGGVLPGSEGTGGFEGDPYRATRGASGWSTAAAGSSGAESSSAIFGAVSPDQGYEFWAPSGEGPAVHAQYVRYPDGHSDVLGQGSVGEDPRARGVLITENGTHIVFQTENVPPAPPPVPLELQSPPAGTAAVYDRTADGITHVVSLLPGDLTPVANQNASFAGASADGEGIAFKIGTTLYLRLRNEVSFEIGTGVTFAGVSEGGERVFYLESGDLFAFDTSSEEVVRFSDVGDAIAVNVAPQGTRAYFVSETAIPDSGENPNGALAAAGEPNLYLSEEGQIRFVATVTDLDVEGEFDGNIHREGLGLWSEALASRQLAKDPSRLTPDGTVLLFQSRADLDSGPGTDGLKQVYRYDSAANRLRCLSCDPTGTGNSGTGTLGSYSNLRLVPLSDSSFVQNLSPGGRRAFFQSESPLVAADTDGAQDVYEWEEAGVGSCARAGGCVYLISSPHSAKDDYLYAQSTSGEDVFFLTNDALLPTDDGGTTSIYDARVGGGFAEPEAPICEGEGCRPGVPPPPPMNPPAKPALGAEDNIAKPKRCPKGKRKVKQKGKVRCVKKHRKHQRKAQGNQKGAGR